ncbi:SDR family NAD(P)-dependent oxidoreductase [Paenibacillus sp. MMS20-IR301]|uniref:SDR family NAD(P)-dependent oxidoreductase n=1 Tax=Paenibacillus sp. MMS20-IR301 TaxID=2895946 RepID=UPI0028EA8C11|nr:SDR family NAD(P)-dependent oxidoreductase [Paenibacillus sp. MMS20-IR301]WNS44683.1 SDR family NAD(P)-dependent oxidoreductase [Paenibacillus sp. MMS20-IR301]
MKTALITGATRGIGRSIATELGRCGYQVAVNGLHSESIKQVVEDIRGTGGFAEGFCANVADPAAVTVMMDEVAGKLGSLDILIHNAGILHDRRCESMTDLEWQSVLDVHLNGAFYCIRRALAHLNYGGDIMLMTSTAGLAGSPGQVNYSAAKAGLLGMVWTLADELKPRRVRVNGIAPAAITDMTRPVIEHLTEKYAERNEPFPEAWSLGEADDVARFVRALLNYKDPELTGQVFGINGQQITPWDKPRPRAAVTSAPEDFFELRKQRRERGADAYF